MLQKYCRNWDKCEETPVYPGVVPIVEIYNESAQLNDEIFYDVERGVVILYSEGEFYESEI